MYIYICMYMPVFRRVYTYVCMYMPVFRRVYAYIYMYVYACVQTGTYVT